MQALDSRLVLARKVAPTDWDLTEHLRPIHGFNWENLAKRGVTLWPLLLAARPQKARRRPEPSLADRADARRDRPRIFNKPCVNISIWILLWNMRRRDWEGMLSFFEDLLAEEMLPAACIVEARKTGEICRSLLQLLEIELWPIGKYELWDQNIFKTQLR